MFFFLHLFTALTTLLLQSVSGCNHGKIVVGSDATLTVVLDTCTSSPANSVSFKLYCDNGQGLIDVKNTQTHTHTHTQITKQIYTYKPI